MQPKHDLPPPKADPTPIGSEKPPEDRVAQPVEIGGPQGPEPTRFGDWERKGRCIDF
jgi:hypothetical protein